MNRAAPFELAIRLVRRMRSAVDVAVVGVLAVLVLVSLPWVDDSSGVDREVGPSAYALVLVAAAGAAARRKYPIHALTVSSFAVAAYLVAAYPFGPVIVFVVLSMYTLARLRPLPLSATLGALTVLLLLVHTFTHPGAIGGVGGAAAGVAWVAMPLTVGAARRLVAAASDRERAAAARQAVQAERLQLSQEVHDVVGHGLAAIQLRADVALHVESQRPEQARAALVAISRASAAALEDLQETLRRIHPVDGNGGNPASGTSLPGLGRAEELCARVCNAGVRVELTVIGGTRALPAAADVAAYRLLQESLTNVVKHSAHPSAWVTIEHTDDAVLLEVTNQDLAVEEATPGIGITGMHRRAASVGGTLYVGPGTQARTFTVRATIPRHDPHASDGRGHQQP